MSGLTVPLSLPALVVSGFVVSLATVAVPGPITLVASRLALSRHLSSAVWFLVGVTALDVSLFTALAAGAAPILLAVGALDLECVENESNRARQVSSSHGVAADLDIHLDTEECDQEMPHGFFPHGFELQRYHHDHYKAHRQAEKAQKKTLLHPGEEGDDEPRERKDEYAEQKISEKIWNRCQKSGIPYSRCMSQDALRDLVTIQLAADRRKKADKDQQQSQSQQVHRK